jgi:hypothetical protein
VKKYFISKIPCGVVNTHGLGDLPHPHGLQMRGAEIHEIPLLKHDFAGDVEDRLLALLNASDEKISASDFVAQIVANLFRVPREHVFVVV